MPFDTLRLEHSSTVDRVAEELRRALFDGEVEAGTPLRELALADAMGVSRSTIREALAILVAEGLATREPNRGVHVTGLSWRSPASAAGRSRASWTGTRAGGPSRSSRPLRPPDRVRRS
jgi:DNA-binding GntR family transcriptional regulator